jgi:hypothetical protein
MPKQPGTGNTGKEVPSIRPELEAKELEAKLLGQPVAKAESQESSKTDK